MRIQVIPVLIALAIGAWLGIRFAHMNPAVPDV